MSTGYRYEAKKQKDTAQGSPAKVEPKPEVIYQVKSKATVGGLSLASKEFSVEPEEIKNPEKLPDKKKQKKVRSNKHKKKKPMNQTWIDPVTGIEMYSYGSDEQYSVPAAVNQLIEDKGLG